MCAQNFREISFLCIWKMSDILLQLKKHGTNTLHVVFIFLFGIHIYLPCCSGGLSDLALSEDDVSRPKSFKRVNTRLAPGLTVF